MNVEMSKEKLFKELEKQITERGFTIIDRDQDRPWGGFFVIDEDEAPAFAKTYFGDVVTDDLKIAGKLSPKILVVQPKKRLSWQYHHRRAEIWKVLEGPVGVMTSNTDEQGPVETFEDGETVKLKQGERHRLVGLDDWGILAEIWQHTDADHPSDEDDIVRVQDDFGR
ncbi:MAG: phosphoheptose isomerase [Fodinibius sp.]|nr:phosphoheptose isomerase [Fodinibius sp.]